MGTNNGYTFMAYLPYWVTSGIEPYNFWEEDFSVFSHIGYSFVHPLSNGTLVWTDEAPSILTRFQQSEIFAPSTNVNDSNLVFGHIYQLFLMKRRYRGMKVGLLIGGGGFETFGEAIYTSSGRENFVKSAVQIVLDYGFDFLEIDWEYPVRGTNGRPEDDTSLYLMLKSLKYELDKIYDQRIKKFGIKAGSKLGKVEIFMAVSAGTWFNEKITYSKLIDLVDSFHIMGFDYCGLNYCSASYHHSNLMKNDEITYVSGDSGVKYLSNTRGISKSQIGLSVPYYGKIFSGTNGFKSSFTSQSYFQYKDFQDPSKAVTSQYGLNLNNMVWDSVAKAPYIYNGTTRSFATFDDLRAVEEKANYVVNNNLNGISMWSVDGDLSFSHPLSLTRKINVTMAGLGRKLDSTPNWLIYNTSVFANIRDWTALDLPKLQNDIQNDLSWLKITTTSIVTSTTLATATASVVKSFTVSATRKPTPTLIKTTSVILGPGFLDSPQNVQFLIVGATALFMVMGVALLFFILKKKREDHIISVALHTQAAINNMRNSPSRGSISIRPGGPSMSSIHSNHNIGPTVGNQPGLYPAPINYSLNRRNSIATTRPTTEQIVRRLSLSGPAGALPEAHDTSYGASRGINLPFDQNTRAMIATMQRAPSVRSTTSSRNNMGSTNVDNVTSLVMRRLSLSATPGAAPPMADNSTVPPQILNLPRYTPSRRMSISGAIPSSNSYGSRGTSNQSQLGRRGSILEQPAMPTVSQAEDETPDVLPPDYSEIFESYHRQ